MTVHDGLCILALNIINEKIFVFLWFWFVFIAIVSILNIVYRLVVIAIPSIRVSIIMARTLFQVETTMVEDILRCSNQNWVDKVTMRYILVGHALYIGW